MSCSASGRMTTFQLIWESGRSVALSPHQLAGRNWDWHDGRPAVARLTLHPPEQAADRRVPRHDESAVGAARTSGRAILPELRQNSCNEDNLPPSICKALV